MTGRGRNTSKFNQNCGDERGNMFRGLVRSSGGARAKVLLTLLIVIAGVVFTAVAFAGDEVTGDGDIVVANAQTTVNLGTVAPGATRSATVRFTLTCKTQQHVEGSVPLAYSALASTIPSGGGASASNGSIVRPSAWPADGANCATPAQTASSGTPTTGNDSAVSITAPIAPGTYSYVLSYAIGDTGEQNDISGSNVTVTYTLTVAAPAKQNQTITFNQPTSPADYNSTFPVSATASSGLSVTIAASGVCTLTSGIVTMTSGTGTCTLTASQGGDAQFNAAPDVVRTVQASKLSQSIIFGALANKTFGDADFAIGATASSGLTVAFSPLGGCNFAVDGKVHITGAGSCSITAAQAGNDNYNAATSVPQTFTIAKATATLTLSNSAIPMTARQARPQSPPRLRALGLSVTYDGSTTDPDERRHLRHRRIVEQ